MSGVFCGLKARKLGLPETWANPMKLVADSAGRGWDQPTKLFLWLLHMRWKNEKKAKTNEEQHNHKKNSKCSTSAKTSWFWTKKGWRRVEGRGEKTIAVGSSEMLQPCCNADPIRFRDHPRWQSSIAKTLPYSNPFTTNPGRFELLLHLDYPLFLSFLFYELQLQQPPTGWVQTLEDSNICIAASTQLQCLPELIYIWGFDRTQRS